MNEPLLEITLRYPLDLSDFEGQDIYTKGNHWLMLEQSQDYVERSVKALADQFVEAFDTYHRPLEDIDQAIKLLSKEPSTYTKLVVEEQLLKYGSVNVVKADVAQRATKRFERIAQIMSKKNKTN